MKNYLNKLNNRLDTAEKSSQAESRSRQSGLTETKQKKTKEEKKKYRAEYVRPEGIYKTN